MWVFTNKGYISVVEDFSISGNLLVRSRNRGHLSALFPTAEILQTSDADYRYRTSVPRDEVANLMFNLTQGIDYTNFKKSIPDEEYHSACASVWQIMRRYQDKATGRS